jgi:diguanylate cyclase (GGDEF)-like protein
VDPSGDDHDVEWHGTNQLGDPLIGGIIVSGRDIAELVAMEARVQLQTQQLSYAADHDPLTEQLNRRAFLDHGSRSIAERRLNGDTGDAVVLFCDLDRFKAVNDTYGHQTGDHLLQIVTARLGMCLRDGDVVGRYGGDEFAVLLGAHASADGVAALVGRIEEHLAEPMAIGEVLTEVGVTVGVARAPVASADFAALLRDADQAMYAAKPGRDDR